MKELLNRLFEEVQPYGRPRIWESPQSMQNDILDYFKKCLTNQKSITDEAGNQTFVDAPIVPTIEGLAIMLNIDRKTLNNYGKEEGYEDFFHTIKRAKEFILACKTNALINGGAQIAGLIFDLKNNHGWADRQDITSDDKPLAGTNITHIAEIILTD